MFNNEIRVLRVIWITDLKVKIYGIESRNFSTYTHNLF